METNGMNIASNELIGPGLVERSRALQGGDVHRAFMDNVKPAPARAKIATALSKAQAEFAPIEKNKTVQVRMNGGGTYSFDYAPLDAVIAAVRPALSKYGMALTWDVNCDGGKLTVTTVLLHESGEELRCSMSPPERINDIKALGGAITYLRRYGAQAVLGVCSEEDDDGSAANGDKAREVRDRQRPTPPQAAKPAPSGDKAPASSTESPDNAPGSITTAAMGRMMGAVNKLNLQGDEAVRAYIIKVIGRDIKSRKEMSLNEARRVFEKAEAGEV